MKKIIIIGLTVFICLNCLNTGVLGNDESNGYSITDNWKSRYASSEEIMQNREYQLNIQTADYVDFIVRNSSFVREDRYSSHTVMIYTSTELQKHLPKCREIIEITVIDSNVCIQYETDDNKVVYLCYSSCGLLNESIYSKNDDSLYYEDSANRTITSNFKKARSYEMSDNMEKRITALLDEGNIEELKKIQSIEVIIDDEGNIAIEPSIDRANPATNNTELLNNLKEHFPMYSNSVKSLQPRYCTAISQNVNVKVTETRNKYTKKSVNWASFAIETSLSVISAFLSITTSGTIHILDLLGIGISITMTILEQVDLCNKAIYNYNGTRRGCVYDPTVYNDYVLILRYSGTGTFTGGYLNSGEFNWLENPSSAYSHPYSTILSNSINNYTEDLNNNNNICTYYQEYHLWND